MTISVRIVADDVDQLDAVALAIGQVLTITRESRPRPRGSGAGVSLYLDAELPPTQDTGPARVELPEQ